MDATKVRKYSICQIGLCNDTMKEDLDLVRDVGVGAVCLFSSEVERAGVGATAALLAERELDVSSYMSGVRVLDGSRDDLNAAFRPVLDMAERVGSPSIQVTSGAINGRSIKEADQELVARLSEIVPRARDRGLVVTMEPVHPANTSSQYLHRLRDAVEVVGQVEGAAIVVDTGHLAWDRQFVDDLERYVDLVSSIQLVDVSPATRVAKGKWEWERVPFGSGTVPLAEILSAADAAGFTGYYEDETITSLPPIELRALLLTSRKWFESH